MNLGSVEPPDPFSSPEIVVGFSLPASKSNPRSGSASRGEFASLLKFGMEQGMFWLRMDQEGQTTFQRCQETTTGIAPALGVTSSSFHDFLWINPGSLNALLVFIGIYGVPTWPGREQPGIDDPLSHPKLLEILRFVGRSSQGFMILKSKHLEILRDSKSLERTSRV